VQAALRVVIRAGRLRALALGGVGETIPSERVGIYSTYMYYSSVDVCAQYISRRGAQ
jgi:hypothetical protein